MKLFSLLFNGLFSVFLCLVYAHSVGYECLLLIKCASFVCISALCPAASVTTTVAEQEAAKGNTDTLS